MWRDYGNQARIVKQVENMILFYAPDDWFAPAPYDPQKICHDWWGISEYVASQKARDILNEYNGRVCDGLPIDFNSGMWVDFESPEDLVTFKLAFL